MTRQHSHRKWRWDDILLANSKERNRKLKKYLPLIGCWVVLALLLGWFVSNDLVLFKQEADHQCEQVKTSMHQWHNLTNNQLFPN